MSQLVKLKRTAVEGKVPNTSNLELGELAINTYDGRIFFEKDNGTPSIQQVVTTNAQTTGSLYIVGDVTASFFVGNGSQLTNLPNPDVSQVATVTSSFDNLASIVVTHNFGSKNVFISVYDTTDSQIIPQSVVLTNNNTVTVGLSANHSGYVVVGKGGHIVSGTLVQEVSEVATITASFDNQSSINVTHNFESRNIIVSIYDSNYSQLIPETLTLTDLNSVDIVLSGNHSGHVVVAKGGHLVSGSIITEADFTELTNIPSGLVSSSNQLTTSLDTRYALSGSSGGGGVSSYNQLTDIPSGIISSSTQITNGSGLVSGSVITTLGGTGVFSGSSQVQFNDISNTPLSQSTSTVTISKSLVPTTTEIDLGTAEKPFRDLYLSSASLYIDGQQVISSNASTLTITTDLGQSIKLLEQGSDDITLQTEDGNIELKGTVEIQTGKKIIDSAGHQVLFGDDIVVSGSIQSTGNINGINLSTFSASIASIFLNQNTATSSYETKGRGIVSGSSQITFSEISSLPTLVSGSSQVISILNELNSYTTSNDTINTAQTSRLDQLSTYTGSNNTINTAQDLRLTSLEGATSSYQPTLSVSDTTNVDLILTNNTLSATLSGGVISGSSQVSYVGLSNIPSGIVSGSTQITPLLPTGVISSSNQVVYTSLSSIPSGIVSGSSQITAGSTTNFVSDVKIQLDSNTIVSSSTQILTLVSIDEDTMVSNSDTKLPTQQSVKQYVDTRVSALVSGSPETLDTLNELASALGNDPNFATTVSNQIGGKVSQSLQIIAGNGLSGGGDLTTNRTLDVVSANNGIVINSDNIQLDTTSTTFKSGVKSELNTQGVVSGSSQIIYTSLSSIPIGIVSGSTQISFNGITDKPTLVSGSSQVISILGSLNSYTSSNDTTNSTQTSRLDQLSTYTASNDTTNTTQNSRLDQLSTYTGSNDTTNTTQNSRLGSLETKTGSLDSTNTTQNSRLTSIESATGSYETRGRGIVSGSSQVSYTGLSSIPSGIVSGSSQITLSSTSGYGSVINQAVLTTSSPTFAGGVFNGDVTSTSGFQGRYSRIFEASAQRGGLYTYNLITGGGADYSIGLFSESTLWFAAGGSVTKNLVIASGGAATFSNNVTVAGTLTENSSIRYKENIETIESGLDKVIQLRGVTYTKKGSGEKEMGLIAEEVYDVLPEVVLKNEEGVPDSLSYSRITAVLIEGMKEQQKQIQELKLEIELLKQR